MKLFFSYGHDENKEIVYRIAEDLTKDGHEVWLDLKKISSGDDWRRMITVGITESDLIMAFASKHSVRDPGVCLNELEIAFSNKGNQILPIILEEDVRFPIYMSHQQTIVMSDWKEHKADGTFEEWYAIKLDEIRSVLNIYLIKQIES